MSRYKTTRGGQKKKTPSECEEQYSMAERDRQQACRLKAQNPCPCAVHEFGFDLTRSHTDPAILEYFPAQSDAIGW